LDYNIETKQIKINLYLPHYEKIKQYHDLKENIDCIVMRITREIAFSKHINHIELNQLPFDANGLSNINELPDYIYYLDKKIQ
jgi:uncharacterized FlgJ-related protein